MIKKVICLTAICLFFSCNDSNDSADCSAVICAPSENTVFIRFLDSESEENLLDNYTIPSETIQITDIESKEVTPIIGETPNFGKLLAFTVSTDTYGDKSYTISFDGGDPFTIEFFSEYSGGGCCGVYTVIDGVEISTYTHEYSQRDTLPLEVTLYID
ncbi:MAG: hypothetical protein RIB79_17625 [Allomuricauda sp.]|jgi:hypothetical protein